MHTHTHTLSHTPPSTTHTTPSTPYHIHHIQHTHTHTPHPTHTHTHTHTQFTHTHTHNIPPPPPPHTHHSSSNTDAMTLSALQKTVSDEAFSWASPRSSPMPWRNMWPTTSPTLTSSTTSASTGSPPTAWSSWRRSTGLTPRNLPTTRMLKSSCSPTDEQVLNCGTLAKKRSVLCVGEI